MGSRIMKQPNGKFCRWSSIIDDFTHYDCTKEEMFDALREMMLKQWTEETNARLNRAEKAGDSSRWGTTTLKALLIGGVFPHGPKHVLERAKLLGVEGVEDSPTFQSQSAEYAESRLAP